ncbi:TetR/AcrR family transcriptional regulator [Kitasatospora sp. MBT63]|uniref:TetR/AcrR family transcriptional regulator n=1 Tax=Kitasatospora sp. MBT63 TaxID=1444768 RepID=UPI000539A976|nr:TetR/AcrR family transcriptional regulator [Kitasatospora sp. MBT63]
MANQPATTHGPRERILAAASALFYRHGINATGIGEVVEVAGVSKRTLYQQFESKDELVAAYLRRMTESGRLLDRRLDRTELAPGERLVALFERPGAAFRGCPMHNASVELTEPAHPGRAVIHAYKQGFLDRLVDTARQAGAADPEELGHRLFVLFEGATALATSINDPAAFDYARPAAATLVGQALTAE